MNQCGLNTSWYYRKKKIELCLCQLFLFITVILDLVVNCLVNIYWIATIACVASVSAELGSKESQRSGIFGVLPRNYEKEKEKRCHIHFKNEPAVLSVFQSLFYVDVLLDYINNYFFISFLARRTNRCICDLCDATRKYIHSNSWWWNNKTGGTHGRHK